MRQRREHKVSAGFTLVELILVMAIMILLATLAVPMMSKLLRSSRVNQGAKILLTALWRGRSEAMRFRSTAAVFFGDDTSRLLTQPLAGVLPERGKLETWMVKEYTDTNNYYLNLGRGSDCPYCPETGGMPPGVDLGGFGGWYPFRIKTRLLSPEPLTLPEGVRALSGRLPTLVGNAADWDYGNFCNTGPNGPIGEIKRHNIVYAKSGSLGSAGSIFAYGYVLVFDNETGDHIVIQAGQWRAATRPRILTYRLANIGGVPVTNTRQIPKLMNDYVGAFY